MIGGGDNVVSVVEVDVDVDVELLVEVDEGTDDMEVMEVGLLVGKLVVGIDTPVLVLSSLLVILVATVESLDVLETSLFEEEL